MKKRYLKWGGYGISPEDEDGQVDPAGHAVTGSSGEKFCGVVCLLRHAAGMQAALVSQGWTDGMIDEFIENFRQKHGFNRHTAMLPYIDKGDADDEPIKLEGGQKMVIQRCIISPDEATTPEEDPDKLEDLRARPKKCPAPESDRGEGGSMGPPPGKKPKKAKQVKTQNPRKTPSQRSLRRGRRVRRQPRRVTPAKLCS